MMKTSISCVGLRVIGNGRDTGEVLRAALNILEPPASFLIFAKMLLVQPWLD